MATFNLLDEDYADIFLTQKDNSDACVSLEEDGDVKSPFQSVLDPQYSDISDFEDNEIDEKFRWVSQKLCHFSITILCSIFILLLRNFY